MRKKLLKILGLIILFQSITISNALAALTTELKTLYFIQEFNSNMFIVELVLLVIAIIKKKKINSMMVVLYLIWFIYIISMSYVGTYIVDTNTGIWLCTIGVLLGIIIIIYTLKKIFEKSLKGDN